jgi:hypothetical protein
MTFAAIAKIGFAGGKYEAMRLEDASFYVKVKKEAELIVKFAARLLIELGFVARRQPQKARYLTAYMFEMWWGYSKKIVTH